MTQSVCSGDLKGEGDRARRLSICEFLEREERCLVMEGQGDHGQQESAGELSILRDGIHFRGA